MKPFHTLTTRGKALRLRRLALAALEHYDLPVRSIRLITNEQNGIFRVDTTGGKKVVLRVNKHDVGGHSLAEIRSEMMWLEAISRETDLGVHHPVPARSGALATTAQVPGVPEPRHCAVFSWVPGPNLADRMTVENVEKQGELSASLHNHAATFVPPEGFSVPTARSVFPFGDPVVLFDPQHQYLFPPDRRRVFEHSIERVQGAIDALYAAGPGPRVVHYDLHQWNVKVVHGKLYAIDFEDLMWGYPAQDIAVTLYYFQHLENGPLLRAAFRRGYARRREWPERYDGEIDTYLMGRQMDLVNFLLQETNPDYSKLVPWFVERAEARLCAWMAASPR